MTINEISFPLGIGTNRFVVNGPNDSNGIDRAAEMVATAILAGAEYVDVANTYSKGAAMEVCRRAFAASRVPRFVTVKSSFLNDKKADDALRRVEETFERLEIEHAGCFVCWNISNYQQFEEITRSGMLYDGAQRAKNMGLVDHICFSTHAPPNDIIKMLKSGAFEGVTISFSVLNSIIMKPVLDYAAEHNIGVIVMNPLGGGLIPQHKEYYSFLRYDDSETTVQAAIRYIIAHPAVKVVLSGISTIYELEENIRAFRSETSELPEARIKRVNGRLKGLKGFCTGCRYCDGCPRGIKIYELMQAWNTTLFPRPEKLYNRTDSELLKTIGICSRLKNTFGFVPESKENPCIGCGRCEKMCTANLPIISRINELYKLFSESCFSKIGMLERLRRIIGDKRIIAFYPGGGYTAYVVDLLHLAYPDEKFKLFAFDANPALWGSTTAGVKVYDPKELKSHAPQMVIVSNYNYSDEIYTDLYECVGDSIPICRLHEEHDVPWVF